MSWGIKWDASWTATTFSNTIITTGNHIFSPTPISLDEKLSALVSFYLLTGSTVTQAIKCYIRAETSFGEDLRVPYLVSSSSQPSLAHWINAPISALEYPLFIISVENNSGSSVTVSAWYKTSQLEEL